MHVGTISRLSSLTVCPSFRCRYSSTPHTPKSSTTSRIYRRYKPCRFLVVDRVWGHKPLLEMKVAGQWHKVNVNRVCSGSRPVELALSTLSISRWMLMECLYKDCTIQTCWMNSLVTFAISILFTRCLCGLWSTIGAYGYPPKRYYHWIRRLVVMKKLAGFRHKILFGDFRVLHSHLWIACTVSYTCMHSRFIILLAILSCGLLLYRFDRFEVQIWKPCDFVILST